ncbi:MAG: prepilin peptidase [Cyanobacteria bacterium SZAS LIN-2]|nr:prepilin peptidase [Cyanobacteria bacterium SZAS LIN-3]MBS1994869.1 prepilin peptidase [Cyanobacteria bacterium SZAS LIN-2]
MALDANSTKYLAIVLVIAAAIIDFRTRKLPNVLVGPAALLGLILNYLIGGWKQCLLALLGAFLGVAVIALPKLLTRSKFKDPIGGGDAKLLGAIGAILLPAGLLSAAFYFCLLYGVFGVAAIIRRKRNPGQKPSTMALGPLIAAGVLLSMALEKQTRWLFGF